jgi:MscS family membrane protein
LEKPIGFIPIILGIFFATEYLSLSGKIELITDHIVRSLIVFVIFWSLVKMVRPLSFLLSRLEEIFTAVMIDWLIRAIEIIFILIAVTTILEIWGIKVGTIIAGLGLFSVAVALGAKDLFRNLISGILVIAEKRFNPGDWIRIDGVVEGTVEHIGLRSTLVRRFDKAPTYVPNAVLADDSLINFSSMTHRRIYWMIGIEYRATIDQLRQIRENIEQFILGSEEFSSHRKYRRLFALTALAIHRLIS